MLRSSKRRCQDNRRRPMNDKRITIKIGRKTRRAPCSSTVVLLTLQLPILTMLLHDSSGDSGAGESPTKGLAGGPVLFWNRLSR